MKQLTLTLIFFLCCILIHAQNVYEGKVVDAQSKEPLAFVTLLLNNGNSGMSTDIGGNFVLATDKIESVTFSYLGYKKLSLDLNELIRLKTIALEKVSYNLQEVTILPGKNPADRIVELAIQNRDINNPEKATEFFYESYNKLVVTGIRDSSLTYKTKDSLIVVDSMNLKNYNYLKDHHYFLMETVSEKNHIPSDYSKETIKASRVSGFKRPFFTLLGTELQSFSLYNNHLEMFSKVYLSPISKGSTSKYLFVIRDTIYKGVDTVFVMSYQPKKGKNFRGLKGSISVNSNLYAVENFMAEPADTSEWPIKIQQKYQFVKNKQWFPVQLNIHLSFEPLYSGIFTTRMIGKSYIQNIELKSRIEKEEFDNLTIKLDKEIKTMSDYYWEENRGEPLTRVERNTYQYVDSIGEKYKADQFLNLSEQLAKGFIRWKFVDFITDGVASFNGHEGFRPGLGIETNDSVMNKIRVGGYGAYGLKDRKWKYGTHLRYISKWESDFKSKISYSKDVVESSGIQFYKNKFDALSNGVIQNFFILQMDAAETYKFETSFKSLDLFEFTFFGSQQSRKINSTYRFLENNTAIDHFNLTEAGVNIRFVFKEKHAEFLGQELPIESKYPLVYLKYSRGFEGLVNGDYNYNRLDISVSNKLLLKNIGELRLFLRAGWVDQELPLTALYRLIGTNDNNVVSVATSYNFQTAFPNEFFSDEYLNLFLRHNFGSLIFKSGRFNPDILLIHSMAFGRLRSRSNHINSSFDTLEKGFYESGILLNKLINQEILLKGYFLSVGFGSFYRYGPYSFSEPWDNLALKFTTYLTF